MKVEAVEGWDKGILANMVSICMGSVGPEAFSAWRVGIVFRHTCVLGLFQHSCVFFWGLFWGISSCRIGDFGVTVAVIRHSCILGGFVLGVHSFGGVVLYSSVVTYIIF